jgi:membrane protein
VVLFIGAVAIIPLILALAGLGGIAEWAIRILRWVLVFVVATGAVALLQLYGPSRRRAKWQWVTWGSMITVVVWLVTAIAFSWYLANFGNYNETYGSLGAAIGFLMWLWVSVFVLLAGAELNSEIEHQTAEDSTVGLDRPLGERGAYMADTVGEAVAKQE